LAEIFSDKYKLIAYSIKLLYNKNLDVSIDNILLLQQNKLVKSFIWKHSLGSINEMFLNDLFHDVAINESSELFDDAYKEIHNVAFARYVSKLKDDFSYDLGYRNTAGVIARARAIIKVHSILFRSKLKDKNGGIKKAINMINTKNPYIVFSSPKLTKILGGWSRGFAGSLIGRPSHGKSTLMTNECLWLIDHKRVNGTIDIFSSEEPEEIFWRRVIAYKLNIPIQSLIYGEVSITESQAKSVMDAYEKQLKFHEVISLSDLKELLLTLNNSEMIWVDHVNSLTYPKGDMYNGIISLVNIEKEWLKSNKRSVIINLSQVNTKEMKKKGRLFPSKEDAFCSSVLEQASRQFLSIYYPYKDIIDKDNMNKFMGKAVPTANDIQLSIEKNSYGDLGVFDLKYYPDYGRYEDIPDRKILLEETEGLFE